VAPLGTSQTIIGKVSQDLRQAVDDIELQKKIAQLGSYTRAMSPAEVTTFVQNEQKTWRPVLEKIAVKQQ
jgi:tripartite-type tricarboxylate transporter receptor subunit TctC